jgi:predicted enzyme related to lactoylglutathione lyase
MSEAEVNYIELPAGDLAPTKAFYAEAFGWDWVDYGPTYAASTSGQIEVALNAEASVGPAHDSGAQNAVGPLVLFGTSDLQAVESAVRAAGGEIVSPIYPYPGGRRFHFADPSGNILGVYQQAT